MISTHDMHIAKEIAGTVHVFGADKRIVKSGKPEDILNDNELLDAHNLIHIHGHRHDGITHTHEH